MKQNEIREAIEYLKPIAESAYLDDYKKNLGLAIKALEKQLHQPPEHKVHEKYKALGKNYYCSCGVMFVDWENQPTNYCGNCGQKLKEE